MKVLVPCEFGGRVRDAFIKRGHDAVSCDLLPTEQPGPHIQGDVLDVLIREGVTAARSLIGGAQVIDIRAAG